MSGFFFRPVDLSSLALFFVAVLVGWRLWRLQPRRPARRWLMLFFASAALFALFSIVANGRLDTWSFYATHLQIVASALSAMALLQYIYRVGEFDNTGRAAQLVLALSALAQLYILGWAGYQFIQLSPAGQPTTNTQISEILIAIGLLWALIVAMRQAFWSGRSAPDDPPPKNFVLLALGVFLLLCANALLFIDTFLSDFVGQDLVPIFIVSIAILMISFNYFLYWDRRNTRLNRMLATSLVLLQSVFTALAIVLAVQLNNLPGTVLPYPEIGYTLTPDGRGSYQMASTDAPAIRELGAMAAGDELLLDADFPLQFFGEEYARLLVTRGRLLFGDEWLAQRAKYQLQPQIFVFDPAPGTAEGRELWVEQSPEAIVVSWQMAEGPVAQFTINPQGVLEMSYRGLGGLPVGSWGLAAGQGQQGMQALTDFPAGNASIPAAGVLLNRGALIRMTLDGWTRPVFIFQLIISVLAAGLLSFASRRLRAQDQKLLEDLLNERQRQIAALVAAGQSNAEIAEELMIARNTVKYHLKTIFTTLNLPDRDSLGEWYRQKN